jgi:hypothetical protein
VGLWERVCGRNSIAWQAAGAALRYTCPAILPTNPHREAQLPHNACVPKAALNERQKLCDDASKTKCGKDKVKLAAKKAIQGIFCNSAKLKSIPIWPDKL